MSNPLISTRELDELIHSGSSVHIIDGSLFPGEDCRAKFTEAHILGAVFFDQDFIRDRTASHSLALVSPSAFAEYMRTLGVPNDGSLVAVYDQYSLISAARVWFLLKYYGYRYVVFLDGGLPKWVEEQRRVVSGETPVSVTPSINASSPFHAAVQKKFLMKWSEMRSIVAEIQAGNSQWQIWDARNPAKVLDSVIPGSTCIFYRDLLNPDGCLKPAEEMREILTAKGLDLSKPIVLSCNRGVVSSAAYLLLEVLGKEEKRNFLGGWLDWKKHMIDAADH